MTYKRFTYIAFDGFEDNGKYITPHYVANLLNELHEENQELKEENEYLCEKIKENEWHWNTIDEDRDVWRYKCKTLEEENEQLKEILHFLENDNAEDILNVLNTQQNEIVRLIEENKQLKQYKEAIWNCDSSKIIRVNMNTGEVDLVDKELEE